MAKNISDLEFIAMAWKGKSLLRLGSFRIGKIVSPSSMSPLKFRSGHAVEAD